MRGITSDQLKTFAERVSGAVAGVHSGSKNLSAAVKAVRAGEAGAGFGVVAAEVRQLSQRCALAAADTSTLINQATAHSHSGRTRLLETAGLITTVENHASKVKQLIDRLGDGAQEQSTGMGEISTALHRLEQMTQSTAGHAQENAAGAEVLESESRELLAIVEKIKAIGASRAA